MTIHSQVQPANHQVIRLFLLHYLLKFWIIPAPELIVRGISFCILICLVFLVGVLSLSALPGYGTNLHALPRVILSFRLLEIVHLTISARFCIMSFERSLNVLAAVLCTPKPVVTSIGKDRAKATSMCIQAIPEVRTYRSVDAYTAGRANGFGLRMDCAVSFASTASSERGTLQALIELVAIARSRTCSHMCNIR